MTNEPIRELRERLIDEVGKFLDESVILERRGHTQYC